MKKIEKLTDEQLILQLQQNLDHCDVEFQELYRRYHKLVRFVAKRILNSDNDVDDIVQETFVEVRRSIERLYNPKYFRMWLYRVIHSKCNDLFRTRKFSFIDSDNDVIQNTIKEEHEDMIPETRMKFLSDQELLMHFIDGLPSRQAMVLTLYYMEQYSIKEIADILDLPEGTVKSRMSSGKSTLKQKIERYEKMEEVQLSFHCLDQAVMMSLFASAWKGARTGIPFKFLRQSLVKQQMKWIMTGVVSGTLVIGGMVIYSGNRASTPSLPHSSSSNLIETFPLSTSTAKYFYLLNHACCAEEIERMNQSKLEELLDVYLALKTEDGYHYHLLQDLGWTDAYENKVINI